jgi:alpha-L-arabinofuranosidase
MRHFLLSSAVFASVSATSLSFAAAAAAAAPVKLTVAADAPGKPISPDLFGIFFEDLNYAADGGLYAELVQNRSFEYQSTERFDWNSFTGWEFVRRGGGTGKISIEDSKPVHPNNPHYIVLDVDQPADGVGVMNAGFDTIPVEAGASYNFSVFARQLFVGKRWDETKLQGTLPLTVRLENAQGAVLCEHAFEVSSRDWQDYTTALVPNATDSAARLVVLVRGQGGVAIDEVSLMPVKTFKGHRNGLRADLAQVIADLKPKFMRFPGGCLVHGQSLTNAYRWKDTIGPVEQRRQQENLWGYHQSVGLGYFEFFQFCEDIGAKPLPVVPSAVSCQNSDHQGGTGQQALPLDQMPAYIQDLLDLIEYANGPATSTWGAKRAAAGHPAPFGLKVLGIGNEEHITPEFEERFAMIYQAVKAAHPEIDVVGTAGPFPDGEDYTKGWQVVNQLKVPVVDEHYYKPPQWFWDNLQRYDAYDRSKASVYVGEYAAHETSRRLTLHSAIAEAAYLTSLERNGDIVRFASYAPLLGRRGHTQWNPDLIYFTATEVYPSINYSVQKLFSRNSGDRYLPTTITQGADLRPVVASAVRETSTGDMILKIVNGGNAATPVQVELRGAKSSPVHATKSVLAGADAMVVNEDGKPPAAEILTEAVSYAGSGFDYLAPANSLTVLRFPGK